MQPGEVRSVDPADAERAVGTLVLAFTEDPIFRWLWPEPDAYLRHFPRLVKSMGGRAFEHGTAHVSADGGGVALWLPPGVEPDAAEMGVWAADSLDERIQSDVGEMLGQMAAHHDEYAHGDHWYLPFIGVDPTHRGKGVGSSLLRHALALCDAEEIVAYLESSNVANVPLYERHGFEVVGEIQVGDSPITRPMIRRPR